ncbi:hypothetical protein ACN3XK_71865 [Actinomadura welshii]
MDPLAGPVERLAWELRQLRERAGRPSYRELADRAHFSRSTLAEAAAGTRLPTLEATVAYAVACGGDRAEWEQRWRLAAREVERSRRRRPYPGAAPLGADDADLFFGRDGVLEELRKAVHGSPVTVLLGASGSGKSSLLAAGLQAALARDGTPVTLITPGALIKPGTLNKPGTLPPAELRAGGADAVVIVDQFEEVFTRYADEPERDRFLAEVSALAAAADGPRLVLGIRSDLYGRCTAHPGLADALRGSVRLRVGPVTERELREIVTGPAEHVGVSVDAHLVSTVLVESAEQMGALPVVAHMLRETWDRHKGDVLRLDDYRAAGGVTGVLSDIAERVHEEVEADRRRLLRAVLLRLVALDAGGTGTRRRIEREELTGIAPPGEVAAVLERLTAARLIVLDRDPAANPAAPNTSDQSTGAPNTGDQNTSERGTVDLAHEALVNGWPRLREWLASDRERLLRHRRLTFDAAEWDRNGRGADYLYRGDRLAEWDEEPAVPLNELERSFLAVSRESAAAGRERSRHRSRLVVGGLSLGAAVVAVLTVLALVQMVNAGTERDRSTSLRLAAQARDQLQRDSGLALLLAIEAYETEPTPEADLVLRQAAAGARLRGSQPSGLRKAEGMAASPDGRRIAIWGGGGLVLWALDGSAPRRIDRELPLDGSVRVHSAAFSEDGRRLVTGGATGQVALWDLETKGPPTVLGTVEGVVHDVSVRDGRVASAHDDAVRIWEPGSGRDATEIRPPGGPVRSVAFSPSGRLLATGGNGSPLHVWDVTGDRPKKRRAAAEGSPDQVAISPRGPWAATVEGDVARIWDVREESDGDWVPQLELTDHSPKLNGLAFAPGGARVATYGADGAIRIWTTGSDVDPMVLRAPRGDWRGVAFAPGGKTLVGIDAGGSLQRWDVTAGDPAPVEGRLLALSPSGALAVTRSVGSVTSARDVRVDVWDPARGSAPTEVDAGRDSGFLAALSPDGRRLAGVGGAGTLRLWDLASGGAPATAPIAFRTVPASLVFSSDGKRLAAGGYATEPQVWQVSGNGTPARVTGWEGQPTGRPQGEVALSPDGALLADARDDHTVLIRNLAGGAEPKVFRGHRDDITGLAFSPDGKRLAAAAADGAVRLWDTGGQGEPVAVLQGGGSRTREVRFSPDGTWLLTNEPEGHLRLWRATGAGEPLELTGWGAGGGLAAFSADGKRITRGLSPEVFLGRNVSTGLGGRLVRTRTCEVCGPGPEVLDLARDRRTRELTAEERRTYLGDG